MYQNGRLRTALRWSQGAGVNTVRKPSEAPKSNISDANKLGAESNLMRHKGYSVPFMDDIFGSSAIANVLSTLDIGRVQHVIELLQSVKSAEEAEAIEITITEDIYELGLVVPFQLTEWKDSLQRLPSVASNSETDLVRLLAFEMRKDHFMEGYLVRQIASGRLLCVLSRMLDLHLSASQSAPPWQAVILTAIDRISTDFDVGQLAYLSLTSKPEDVIRNALAWRIQQIIDAEDGKSYAVAREWERQGKRFDLAIVRGSATDGDFQSEVEALIEIKVCSGFDYLTEPPDHHREAYRADVEKLESAQVAVGSANLSTFFLVVNSNAMSEIDGTLGKVVKYSFRTNNAIAFAGGENIHSISNGRLERTLGDLFIGIVNKVHVDAGAFFGVHVLHDHILITNPAVKSNLVN